MARWQRRTLRDGATLLDGSSEGRTHDGFAVLSEQLVSPFLAGFEWYCVLVERLDGIDDLDPGEVTPGVVQASDFTALLVADQRSDTWDARLAVDGSRAALVSNVSEPNQLHIDVVWLAPTASRSGAPRAAHRTKAASGEPAPRRGIDARFSGVADYLQMLEVQNEPEAGFGIRICQRAADLGHTKASVLQT